MTTSLRWLQPVPELCVGWLWQCCCDAVFLMWLCYCVCVLTLSQEPLVKVGGWLTTSITGHFEHVTPSMRSGTLHFEGKKAPPYPGVWQFAYVFSLFVCCAHAPAAHKLP